MKRFILSLATAVFAVTGAFAEESTFNFNTSMNVYGLTWQKGGYDPDIATPKTIEQDGITLTLNTPDSGGYAFGGSMTSSGINICGDTKGASMTLSAEGYEFTEIQIYLSSEFFGIQVDGQELPLTLNDWPNYGYTWTGSSKSVTMNFKDADAGKYGGYKVAKFIVTYKEAAAPAPTYTYLTLSGTNPADGASFANWQAPAECTFDFTNDTPGSFPGIAVNRDCKDKIQVLKMNNAGKYVLYYDIDPANTEKVYVDSRYDARLHVVFNEPLPLTGTNVQEQYQIVIPEGLVTKFGASASPEGDVSEIEINKEETVVYTIKKLPGYTSTPKNGETISTMSGNLNTVVLNFEQGTVLKTADSVKATIYKVTSAGLETEVGTYSLSYSGSEVTLTYDGTDAIPTLSDASTYKIVIPEGAIMIDDGWGMYDAYPESVISGLRLVGFDASLIKFEGLDTSKDAYESAQDIPTEFTMIFPGPMTSFGNLTSTTACKLNFVTSSTKNVGYYHGTVSEDKTSVTWKLVTPTTTSVSMVNHPELWIAGNYTLTFAANLFKYNTENNAAININWTCKTGSDNVISSQYINVAKKFYKDGQLFIESKKIEPKNYGSVANDPGFGQIMFQFLTTCKMNVGADAAVTLKKDDSDELLLNIAPADILNVSTTEDGVTTFGHIWNTVGPTATTATNKANANSQSWYFFYDLSTEKVASSAAGAATTYLPNYLKTPGNYTFHVDKGFFITDGGVLSQELDVKFTILGLDLETTVEPADKAVVESLKDITVTYPEGAVVSVEEGKTVQLGYTTPLSEAQQAMLPVFNISAKDNVVTLSANEAFAIPDRYNYVLNIPGGVWNVTYQGVTEGNRSLDLQYSITSVAEGTVTPAPTAEGETISVADLSTIVYNSVVAISDSSDASLGNAILYSVANETRTQVATYTGVASGDKITWTTTADLSALDGGEYEFVIPASAVTYKGLKSTLTATKDFAYNYTIADKPISFTTVPEENTTLSTITNGLSTVTINYPEGASVVKNENAKAALYTVAADGAATEVGTYNFEIEGNVVKLVYAGETAPAVNNHYKVVVEAGSLNVAKSAGANAVENPEIVIDNLKLVFLDASVIKFEGLDTSKDAYENATELPTEFTMIFPGPMTSFGNLTSTTACKLNLGTKNVGYYHGTVSEDKTSVTWKLVTPTTTSVSMVNHPELWIAGNYTLTFAANLFKYNTENNAAININWTCKTGSDNVISSQYINVAKKFYKDGQLFIESKKIEPKNYGSVANDPGFGQIMFQFLTTCKMNVGADAAVTLKKDDSDELLLNIAPADILNVSTTEDGVTTFGHIWNTVGPTATTATNKANANSQSWYFFYDLSTEKVASSAAGAATTYLPNYLKTPGNYTFHVDKGFFITDGGVLSQELDVKFTILGLDLETTVEPADKAVVESLKDITVTYPEGAVVSVEEGKTVQLGYTTPLSEAQQAMLPVFNISAKDNVVTLSANEAFAIPDRYNYVLNIPGGVWNVTYQGVTEGNRSLDLQYSITSVAEGTVTPAPTAEGETISVADLSTIVYNSVVAISDSSDASLGNAILYSVANETRTQVATYTGVASGKKITWTTTANLTDLASGEYEFVIPASAVPYKGLKSTVNADKDFVYSYDVKGIAKLADIFTLVQPTKTEIYDYELGEDGISPIAFSFKETDLVQSTDANLKMTLSFDGDVIAEIPATSDALEFEEAMVWGGSVIEGSLYIYLNQVVKDFDLSTPGTYTLAIPNGMYKIGEDNLVGTSYTITVKKKPVDFTYTLAPEAGAEVESLAEIVLKFPNAGDINYASDSSNPVATLTSEDGTVVETCIYPGTDWKNTLTLKFGGVNTKWINGKYTLTVHGGTINLDNANFDDSAIGTGNFEGLTAEYTLNAKEEEVSIMDYIQLQIPSSLEANPLNTTNQSFGACGMGLLGFGLKTSNFVGVQGSEFLSFYYQKDATSARELMTTLNPANGGSVFVMSGSTFDENGFGDFTPTSTLFVVLANNGEGDIDETLVPDYSRDGYYTLVIPDGAFRADGILLKGTEITFHFTNETGEFKYEYNVTPEENTTNDPITNPAEIFGVDGTGVVVTFVGTTQIDCVANAATLTLPDGTVLKDYLPDSNWRNTMTWKFGTTTTNWPAKGEYVFELLAGKVYVEMGNADDLEDAGIEGNFPGMKVVYYVDKDTSVAMIGVEPADAYTIFTIDGKLVRLNATPDQLIDIEPGLYIINGKKAFIRK